MRWTGIDSSTPTNDAPGALTTAQNLRSTVMGELRRRRGTARTSLAKASGAVMAIADFALSPNLPYALTLISGGSINGDQGISSLWGDAALSPVSGTSTPDTASASFTIAVARGSSQFATSVMVFAQSGRYPTDADVGTYVGEYTMSPWSTTASGAFTAPESGSWYFRAYPVRDRALGPGYNLVPTPPFSPTDFIDLALQDFTGYDPGRPLACAIGFPPAYIVGTGTFSHLYLNDGLAINAGAAALPLSGMLLYYVDVDDPTPMFLSCSNSFSTPASLVFPAGVIGGQLVGTLSMDSGGILTLV